MKAIRLFSLFSAVLCWARAINTWLCTRYNFLHVANGMHLTLASFSVILRKSVDRIADMFTKSSIARQRRSGIDSYEGLRVHDCNDAHKRTPYGRRYEGAHQGHMERMEYLVMVAPPGLDLFNNTFVYAMITIMSAKSSLNMCHFTLELADHRLYIRGESFKTLELGKG